MESIFFELGIVISVAALLAIFFRLLKQPPLLAYLVTGIIMGPAVFNLITAQNEFQTFSQIGVAFLLFIVGLNLNIKILREVGKVSLYTGLGQVIFTSLIGYFLIIFLGFTRIEAVYISLALAFSSTIIIVKLLSDKRDMESLYGKISIGFLLVQDAIAIFILITLKSFNTLQIVPSVVESIFKAVILCIIAYVASKFFLKKFFEKVAKSTEILFLTAISWCFILSILAVFLGFTIEIGAFIAGISLASLPYTTEISNKIKPLRDFFIILFFVVVGSSLSISNIASHIWIIFILSVFVLIGNPLIVMGIMGLMGFKSRTGFLAGLTVAQISEFSLILAAAGFKLGHLSTDVISIISAVGIITIAISTYMITNNEKLYLYLSPFLKIFERKNIYEKKLAHHKNAKKYNTILMGRHRIGYSVLRNLNKKKDKFLVVDFNPAVIKELISKKIPCIYGDIADPEILEELKKFNPKLIISTIHVYEDSVLVTEMFRKINKKITIVVTANTVREALDLYELGANYVIIPHILGGERVSEMLRTTIPNKKRLGKLRNKHIKSLINADNAQQ